MQPADAEEANKRALYYCHSVYLCCKQQITSLLKHAGAGNLGAPARDALIAGVSEWSANSATKILTCVWLDMIVMSRCANGAQPWLVEFLFEALRETDELFPNPSAEDIMAKYVGLSHYRMLEDTVEHVQRVIGFPPDAYAAASLLKRFLAESQAMGDELLVFALSQPGQALRDHLQMLEQR